MDALRAGASRKAAARIAGISPATLAVWQNEYPEFLAQMEQAESELQLEALIQLQEARANGDAASTRWLLEKKFPEEFGKRIDLRMQFSPEQVEGLQEVLRRVIVQLPPAAMQQALEWLELAGQGLPLPDLDDELLMLEDGAEE